MEYACKIDFNVIDKLEDSMGGHLKPNRLVVPQRIAKQKFNYIINKSHVVHYIQHSKQIYVTCVSKRDRL